ncbi:hypothetical protein KEM52_003224 [Ascosphaera acerosa]|nr:hypothetical protein KEM52_003224 [Ascosphaera acerosa]
MSSFALADSGAPNAAVPNPDVRVPLEGDLASTEVEVTLQQTLDGHAVPHRTFRLTPKGHAIMAAWAGQTPVFRLDWVGVVRCNQQLHDISYLLMQVSANLRLAAAPELPPAADRELSGLFRSTLDSVDTAGRVLRGLPFRVVDVTGRAAVDFTSARTKVEWLRRAARELGYCLVPLGPEEPTFGETEGEAPAPPLSPRALPPAAARTYRFLL